MTDYQIYQVITIVLYVLIVLILLYDVKSLTEYNYKYHFIRLTILMLLAITLLYVLTCYALTCLDANEEKQNAEKFEQHFKIEEQDEKYITKFQQEFLQNIIDVKINDIKFNKTLLKPANTVIYIISNKIPLVPINEKGYISLDVQTNRFEELKTNSYFEKNKEKFKKSLKDNPIRTETLIKILKNDLTNDFTITQETIKDSNGIENQWIVISWN